MNRNFSFAPGEFYHLYNRGVEKRKIFLDKADHNRFVSLLYLANSQEPVHVQFQGRTLKNLLDIENGSSIVDVIAYCLMPNHFHILAKETTDGGISKFMQKLSTGYSMYFNKRYERSGALFQGKFKAAHADTDKYLKYLYSYIHLNPVKLIQGDWKENGIKNVQKTTRHLNMYSYSSYLDYKKILRPENKILNIQAGPCYFGTIKELEREMQDWLISRSDLEN